MKKNVCVKVPKATVKKNRDHTKRAKWKKDRNDLEKDLAALTNKVMDRKAANQAEDEKVKTKEKTVMLSGNVWRTWRTSLTC